jgi:hypothetical protein
MRKSLSLILSIAFILAIGVLASAHDGTKTYVNTEIGFTMEYPASWKNTKVEGGHIVVLFTGGAINRNVQVIYDRGGEEGGKAALERLANILRTQKELSAEWKEINGRPSFLQIVEWESLIGANRAIRLMVPFDDHYFLVMSVCPAGEFEDLRPLLEKCVLSFKIID